MYITLYILRISLLSQLRRKSLYTATVDSPTLAKTPKTPGAVSPLGGAI